MSILVKIQRLIILSLLPGIASCTDPSFDKTISFEATTGKFTMIIPIEGELEAAKSTAISMNTGSFEPQVIAWLAEENSLVKKGDIVARFDATKYIYDSKQELLRMQQVDISYRTKENVLTNEKGEIITDANLISDELELVDRFALEDLQVFSKNEIIDSMKNRKYLEARQVFTEWRANAHEQKSTSELALLDLQRQKHNGKINQYESALDKTEVKAPHDGIFLLEKNHRGEKPHVGDITWPGRKIGSLPDMSVIQAKIHILESEAAGLELEQRVEFALDAFPDELIEGKVIQIDAIAKSMEKGNPVKYFDATVKINSQQLNHWRPGVQLRGKIYVIEKNNVISIPSQAIFRNESMSYVFIYKGGGWSKQEIKLGSRSLSLTEIQSGIDVGDIIALYHPDLESNE